MIIKSPHNAAKLPLVEVTVTPDRLVFYEYRDQMACELARRLLAKDFDEMIDGKREFAPRGTTAAAQLAARYLRGCSFEVEVVD